MRRALIVGVDFYENIASLRGAVKDARRVNNVLEYNDDEKVNFQTPKLMLGVNESSPVTRADIRNSVEELFAEDAEVALFYFSGHGYIDATGGFLCASDCATGDDGLPLQDIMSFANNSPARNKIILIDSCHSGDAGRSSTSPDTSEIKEGVTILTASTAEQYAIENEEGGVFTTLLVDALSGSAANLVGDVTPGSIYAHIDQSLGTWDQRPVFKTNVKRFVSLRKASSPIQLKSLRKLTELFKNYDMELSLDPAYEPERSQIKTSVQPDPIKTADFAILQELVAVNLVEPVGAQHMWHAAMNSKACRLTVLGQHYWKLVSRRLI